jgi:hypothetical protein
MDLDGDPAELRRTIDLIGGKVTSLRAYARRREAAP